MLANPDPAKPLTFHLFGSFEALRAHEPLPRTRSRTERWLLALLILRHGEPLGRSRLAGVLWPDSPDAAALANLRRSLRDLRRVLGADAWRLSAPTPRTLRFDLSAVRVDALEFDHALNRGDAASLAEAVALYRGPLLAECDEDWVLPERTRREQAYLQALDLLAAQARARGDAPAATGYLRRAILADPLRESLHRALMEVFAGAGDYAAATQVYRDLRTALHRELNSAPSAETVALYERLRTDGRRRAGEGISGSTPAPRPTSGGNGGPPSGTLPRPGTRLIGRSEAVREVCEHLSEWRLLTLTGVGGVGKTRLAIEVAQTLASEYREGVRFVNLAPLSPSSRLTEAVAKTLGVREASGRPLEETLLDVLRGNELLLLMDNCEHVVSQCSELIETILEECPGIRVLATSRELLKVAGEKVWRVPSLQFPGEEDLQGSDSAGQASLLEYDSLRLFVERAAQIEPGFRIDARDIRATAQICRRLDGIPLAIELAAARVGSLSLPGISERLDDRFRLLTGGRRTALPRHQTLAALIDWSFNLLPDAERTLLQRLSVFVGGWTLEAAARVCGGFGLAQTESEILDLLRGLIEKSLVVYEPSDTQPPYRLLETVRQYAWEQLAAAGETERVRGAHLNTMFELVDAADHQFGEAQLDEWLDMLERDHGNLLAALEWALIADTDREAGFRLAISLWGYWEVRGYYAEGREWTEKLAKLAHSLPERQSRLLLVAANLAMWQGDTGEAMSLAQEAMEISRRCDDQFGIAGSLTCMGGVAARHEDVAGARTYYEQGLAAWRELGDAHFVAAILNNLGVLCMMEGKAAEAEKFHLESLAMRRELQSTRGIATSYRNLGIVAMHSGDPSRALGYSQECLIIMKRMADPGGMAAGIEGIADATFALRGEDTGIASDCVRLLGAATTLRESAGVPLTPFMQREHQRLTEHLATTLGRAAYEATWNDGRQMPREAAFQLASRLSNPDQNEAAELT